jgi:hypothetical protein
MQEDADASLFPAPKPGAVQGPVQSPVQSPAHGWTDAQTERLSLTGGTDTRATFFTSDRTWRDCRSRTDRRRAGEFATNHQSDPGRLPVHRIGERRQSRLPAEEKSRLRGDQRQNGR